jgi:hypothetical protein
VCTSAVTGGERGKDAMRSPDRRNPISTSGTCASEAKVPVQGPSTAHPRPRSGPRPSAAQTGLAIVAYGASTTRSHCRGVYEHPDRPGTLHLGADRPWSLQLDAGLPRYARRHPKQDARLRPLRSRLSPNSRAERIATRIRSAASTGAESRSRPRVVGVALRLCGIAQIRAGGLSLSAPGVGSALSPHQRRRRDCCFELAAGPEQKPERRSSQRTTWPHVREGSSRVAARGGDSVTPIRVTAASWPLRCNVGSADNGAESGLSCLQIARRRLAVGALRWVDPAARPAAGGAEMCACGECRGPDRWFSEACSGMSAVLARAVPLRSPFRGTGPSASRLGDGIAPGIGGAGGAREGSSGETMASSAVGRRGGLSDRLGVEAAHASALLSGWVG